MRRQLPFSTCMNNSSALATRGPKKKGAVPLKPPDNPDIVNIFKGAKDCQVYPSDAYPPWLMDLLKPSYTVDEIVTQMYRGERIPDAKEQWTLHNALKRQKLKDYNVLHKWHEAYESDDDFGEDLGGAPNQKGRGDQVVEGQVDDENEGDGDDE